MRYELTVTKRGCTVTRAFCTLEKAYEAYDACKAGYPVNTHVVLTQDGKTIAEYKA